MTEDHVAVEELAYMWCKQDTSSYELAVLIVGEDDFSSAEMYEYSRYKMDVSRACHSSPHFVAAGFQQLAAEKWQEERR